MCKTRRCSEEKTISQVLLCAAPKPAEARTFLEKYLGKINTAIADANLTYAVNFNYQVFSVCNSPIPPNTNTPTFDSELGIEIDTATITVIPEIP